MAWNENSPRYKTQTYPSKRKHRLILHMPKLTCLQSMYIHVTLIVITTKYFALILGVSVLNNFIYNDSGDKVVYKFGMTNIIFFRIMFRVVS